MFSYKILPLALLISLPAFAMEQKDGAVVPSKLEQLQQAVAVLGEPVASADLQKPAPELLDTVLALGTHEEIAKRKECLEARKQELAKKLAEETAALDAELKQTATEAEKNTEALEKLREKKCKVIAGVDKALERLQTQYKEIEAKKANELALEDVALSNILKGYEQERETLSKKEALAKETFANKKTTLEQAYDVELQKVRGSIAVQEKRRKEKGEQLNDISLKINVAKPAVTEEKAKEEATPKVSGGFWSYFTWKSSTTQQ